jgi:site-specific recombinase XerD
MPAKCRAQSTAVAAETLIAAERLTQRLRASTAASTLRSTITNGMTAELTRIRLPHVHEFRDRHGKLRRYVRLPGRKKVPLPGSPGSAEFMAVYQAALDGKPAPIGASRYAVDTIAAWVGRYLASKPFAALAQETRRTRRNILERFRKEHGDKRGALLLKRHIERMLADKAETPSAARNFLNTLRAFLDWCVLEDLRADNPATGITAPAIKTDGYATWPEEYVATYRNRFELGTKARLALELLACTGAARCDAIRMGRQHVREGTLSFRRKKTKVQVEMPVLPEMQAAIDAMPARDGAPPQLTFLVTEYGKQFTDAGFGNWFRDRCNEAGIPVGYSAHGIRKYAATRFANRGATAHELMAWFGWLTIREAERYTKAAARRDLAFGVVRKLAT